MQAIDGRSSMTECWPRDAPFPAPLQDRIGPDRRLGPTAVGMPLLLHIPDSSAGRDLAGDTRDVTRVRDVRTQR